jgi:Uma2 family endonuclease
MGTKALITPEQYLAAHYERQPEYVRGEVKEKPLPDAIHVWLQRLLMKLIEGDGRPLIVLAELRCKLAPDVYRLPDLSVFSSAEKIQRVPTRPPLAVIEVVSEDERYVDLVATLRDYERWNVLHIWVVDPWSRRLATWKDGAMLPVDALRLDEYDFEVRLEHLLHNLPIED